MSIVTVAIGQCGVTVVDVLYVLAAQKTAAGVHQDMLFRNHVARCVLVDTEAKVIQATRAQAVRRSWQYDPRHIHFRKAGAANNWAYGYHKHGSDFYELIKPSIAREVRACECFGGFVILHSLAGGTGSGLGTRITERLRIDYPFAVIVNQVIWPYHQGEVIVQNYNMMFTLHRLYLVTNLVLVVFNDHLHQICTRRLGLKSVSFQDLNAIAALCLYNVLCPCHIGTLRVNSKGKSIMKMTTTLVDLVRAVSPHPLYKLSTIKYVPQVPSGSVNYTVLTWQSLMKHLLQMSITDIPTDEQLDWTISLNNSSNINRPTYHRSLAILLIAKGNDLSTLDATSFRDCRLYPEFTLDTTGLTLWTSEHDSTPGLSKWAGTVCNSTSIIHPLQRSLRKAIAMFHQSAFVHQYAKYGVSPQDFLDAFSYITQSTFVYLHSFCV